MSATMRLSCSVSHLMTYCPAGDASQALQAESCGAAAGSGPLRLSELSFRGSIMTFENPRSTESSPWRFRAANHPDILPIRAFQDNYIWLMAASSRNGERLGLVVDPGEAA